MVARICEDVQDWSEDEVHANGRDFCGRGFGNFVSQISTAGRSLAHGAGELADVVLIEEAVDTTVFLIEGNQQGIWVAGLVSNGLKLLD